MKPILKQLQEIERPEESDYSTQEEYYTAVLEYEEQKQGIMDGFAENVKKSKTMCDLYDRKAEADLIKRKFG